VVQEADTAIAAAAAVNPLTAQSINHSIPHSFFLCKSLCACSYAGQAPPPCILHFAALLLLHGPVVVECELRSFDATPLICNNSTIPQTKETKGREDEPENG
jgi:hypothetical protein